MSRLTRTLVTVLVLVAPVTVGLFRVWVHQDVVQLGYKLSKAEKQRRTALAKLEELQVEHAAAKSPGRLQKLARELELYQPSPREVYGISLGRGTP